MTTDNVLPGLVNQPLHDLKRSVKKSIINHLTNAKILIIVEFNSTSIHTFTLINHLTMRWFALKEWWLFLVQPLREFCCSKISWSIFSQCIIYLRTLVLNIKRYQFLKFINCHFSNYHLQPQYNHSNISNIIYIGRRCLGLSFVSSG